MKKGLTGLLLLSAIGFGQVHAALDTAINTNQAESQQQTNIQTFTLNLWAPDETPPIEAKLAEIGDSYHYLYTPDSLDFAADDINRIVKFRFHSDTNQRYQFRWVTAEHPEDVTLLKKKDHKIKIALDDGEINEQIYFEVWVYDTLTGERFMCDPEIIVGRPPIPN